MAHVVCKMFYDDLNLSFFHQAQNVLININPFYSGETLKVKVRDCNENNNGTKQEDSFNSSMFTAKFGNYYLN